MRAGVMAKGEAHDAGFGVFRDPDARMRLLVFVAVARFGEDFAIPWEGVEKVKAEQLRMAIEVSQERLRGLSGPSQFSRMVKRHAEVTKNTAQMAP